MGDGGLVVVGALLDRLGSSIFSRVTFLYGMRFRCAMQLRRARFLSSDRRMCHGACFVSVALSIMSRAREYSYQRVRDGRSIGLSFHWRSGSSMRASNRRSCSLLLTRARS